MIKTADNPVFAEVATEPTATPQTCYVCGAGQHTQLRDGWRYGRVIPFSRIDLSWQAPRRVEVSILRIDSLRSSVCESCDAEIKRWKPRQQYGQRRMAARNPQLRKWYAKQKRDGFPCLSVCEINLIEQK
jgi:hypothetical protein